MGEQQRPPKEPSKAAIRDALQRIVAHAPFDRSPVLCRFLTHVVEHGLNAGAQPLKEYAIGVDVFDRAGDFDPRIDTIVRVQARRLRDALANYYEHDGRNDRVRLAMPKGQYGIRARFCDSAGDPAPASEIETPSPGKRFVTTLPAPRTPLIGREAELERLRCRIEDEGVRLLTITGVGGSGKTRLALALAENERERYPGGLLFLDLSTVARRAVLLDRLADAFKLRRTEGRPLVQAVVERLRCLLTRPTLLVLDNMERVLDGADVLGELLDASSLLSILVTSRVPLRLYGEVEYPLVPLAVPGARQRGDAAGMAAVPAVRLFLARAEAANPSADLLQDIDALAELCVRLDGLPLAIELVAAQAGVLNPRQMLERFTGHLDLPENPARDAPSRQRTLRRVIDWSYDLLDEPARIALRRLSVFAGGFTLEAAEAVADAAGDLGNDLMPAIDTLVGMGLVYFRSTDAEPRFAMLETLRAYGLERLNASGEADRVRKAHAAYCLVLAEEGIGTLDIGRRRLWLARCDSEQDNFRRALEYLLRRGPPLWALRLGQALFGYWERKEKLTEGGRLLQRIVDRVPAETDPNLWAKVRSYAATLLTFLGEDRAATEQFVALRHSYRQRGDRKGEVSTLVAQGVNARLRGDESKARTFFRESLDLCREIGEPSQVAAALSNLAQCELRLGRCRAAHDLLNEARDLFVAEHDSLAAAWCLNHLGDVARAEREFELAARRYARAEAEFVRLGDAWGSARSKSDRGRLALDRGDLREAGPLLLEALRAFEALDHQRGMAAVADTLAALAQAAGRLEAALKLVAAAEKWRTDVGFIGRRDDVEFARRLRDRARSDLGDTVIDALHEAGSTMTAADAAAIAVSILDSGG